MKVTFLQIYVAKKLVLLAVACFYFQVLCIDTGHHPGSADHLKAILYGNEQSYSMYLKHNDDLKYLDHSLAANDYDLLIKRIHDSTQAHKNLFEELLTHVENSRFNARKFLVSSDLFSEALRNINHKAEHAKMFSTSLSKQNVFVNLVYKKMGRMAHYITQLTQSPRQQEDSPMLSLINLSIVIFKFFDSYGDFDPASKVSVQELKLLRENSFVWKREFKMVAGLQVDLILAFDECYKWVQQISTI